MNVGIIGAGAISGIYLENMIHKYSNIHVSAICANHLERAQIKAEKYVIKACTLDEMLQDKDIDLCVVLTPVDKHYEIIRKVLLAGKHAYTEKTISQTTTQAKELLKIATEKNLYLGSAPDTFLGAAVQTAKKAIEDNLIGEIYSFSISINRKNDLLTALYPFLCMPGAGVLRDYQVYYLTALLYLLGPVRRTCAFVKAPVLSREDKIPGTRDYGKTVETPNESVVSAVLELENGIVGTIQQNHETIKTDLAEFNIYGRNGILKLSNANYFGGEVRLLKDVPDLKEDVDIPPIETILEPVNDFSGNARGIGVSEMVSAYLEGRTIKASKELAYHVLEVLESMEKSSKDGTMETIDSRF